LGKKRKKSYCALKGQYQIFAMFFIDAALSGRNSECSIILPKALPLGWDIKGFQPFLIQRNEKRILLILKF